MYESLTKHLLAIEKTEGFGDWVVGRKSKVAMDDLLQMPCANYGMTVTDVEQAIYAFVDEHPEYEFTRYSGILERNGLPYRFVSGGKRYR